jgi:hypothetical protein
MHTRRHICGCIFKINSRLENKRVRRTPSSSRQAKHAEGSKPQAKHAEEASKATQSEPLLLKQSGENAKCRRDVGFELRVQRAEALVIAKGRRPVRRTHKQRLAEYRKFSCQKEKAAASEEGSQTITNVFVHKENNNKNCDAVWQGPKCRTHK